MTRTGIRPRRALASVRAMVGATVVVASLACGAAEAPPTPAPGAAPVPSGTARSADAVDPGLPRLLSLYEARDYFALATALDDAGRSPEVTYLRAALERARNQPASSNRVIREALEGPGPLPDTLVPRFERMRYRNHFRLGEYARALEALRVALAHPSLDLELREDLENEVRLLESLRHVPPQQVARRGDTRVDRLPNTRVPVTVQGVSRAYVLDTGANLSVLMRSEADTLGLEVLPAGVEVGSITGGTLTADVAVADEVRLGEVVLRHVVFLVLPDEALTFAEGRFTIPGILGFPVLEALGEVAFRGTASLRIPGEVPEGGPWNLALHDLNPVVRVGVLGDTVICPLDTGAGSTSFYRSFYDAHGERVRAVGARDTARFAGAGGEVSVDAWVLPEVRLAVGDTAVLAREVPVYVERLSEREKPFPPCNLGLDVLTAFDEYVLNFRSMTLLLR